MGREKPSANGCTTKWLLKRKTSNDIAWGSSGKQAVYFQKLTKCLSKAGDPDRKLLLAMAQKMVGGRTRRGQAAA
jgi:hypothetical protein